MKYSERIAELEQSEQVAKAAYDTAVSTGMSEATIKKYKIRYREANLATHAAKEHIQPPLEVLIARVTSLLAEEVLEAQQTLAEFHEMLAKRGIAHTVDYYGSSVVTAEYIKAFVEEFQRDLAEQCTRKDYLTAWATVYDYHFQNELRRLRRGVDWDAHGSSAFGNAVDVCKAKAASRFLEVIEQLNTKVVTWQHKPSADDEVPA